MTSELSPDRPVNVLIVEDDPALRDDFARAVREGLALIAADPVPDVLLVDLGLPDGEGTTLIRALRTLRAPEAKALVISVFSDEAHVVRALQAGAHGYLLKDATAAELVQATRDVLAGAAPLSPLVARYLLRQFALPPAAPATAAATRRLSSREAEILTLVANGHSGPEVASRLGLSLHTVNTHLRNCHAKLDASNRVQAVNRARGSGQIG
jgi:DNA-binding NarL/FixJ family response regulator